jgi:hypothetical protein
VGGDWTGAKNAILGNWDVRHLPDAHRLRLHRSDGAGQSLQATRSIERPDRVCDGKTNASGPDDV